MEKTEKKVAPTFEPLMKANLKIDGKVQKEMLKNQFALAYIFMAIGIVGLVAYIIVDVILEIPDYSFLLYFSVSLGVGVGLLYLYKNMVKSADKMNKENIYSFHTDYMYLDTIYHGEVEASTKLFYTDIFKIKETKNYIFVYPDSTKAYPIPKSQIKDLNALRKMLYVGKITYKGK